MRYERSNAADGGFRLYSIGGDRMDDQGELVLDEYEPRLTQPYHPDYLGDWLWPVVPLDFSDSGDDRKG